MAKVEIAEILDRLIEGGLILLLVLSTLAFGAVSGWGRAGVILLAAFLFFCWACRTAADGEMQWYFTPLDGAVLAFVVLFLIQLAVGFPWGWDSRVNPEKIIAQAIVRPGWLPFLPGTLDYHATREAFVLFLMYAGVFYLIVHSMRSRPQLDRLLTSLSWLAAVVVFYGLVEFLSGNRGIFGWKGYAPARVRGTLVNPDHFAAYLGMVIPVAIAFLIGSDAGRRRRRSSRPKDESSRHPVLEPVSAGGSGNPVAPGLLRQRRGRPWERDSRQLVLGLGCVLMIVGLVFSLSRAGISSFLVGCLFFVALLWIREPGHRRRLAVIGIGLAGTALVTWIGAEPVLLRFGALETDSGSRGRLYWDVVSMIRDFPILGAGIGTFDRVFPRYASPEFAFGVHVRHAHSEQLQLAAEGGVVAVAVLILGLVALMRDLLFRRLLGLIPSRVSRERSEAPSPISAVLSNPQSAIRNPQSEVEVIPHSPIAVTSTFDIRHSTSEIDVNPKSEIRNPKFPGVRRDAYNISIAFGCLSSIVVIFVHSLFEFPLRIPANGILAATVLGIAVVAVGIRLHAEGAESLLPTCVLQLSRRGRTALVLVAGFLGLFMGWTAVSATLAEELGNRGQQIIAEEPGPDGRGEKPWVVETGRNREALGNLSLAVWLDPLSADSQYRLGRLYEQLALRAWNAGLSEEGKFLPDLPSRARVALGILDEAMRWYATTVVLAPPHAEAWGRLGWAYGIRSQIAPFDPAQPARAAADPDLALAGIHQAIALNPNNRYRHEVLAAFGFGRLEGRRRAAGAGPLLEDPIVHEAVRAQQRAVELDPAYLPEALQRVLRHTQDTWALLRTVPDQAPDALFAARLLEEQELWPQAKALFQRAIALAPDDGKPLYYREYAGALTRRGEDAEARDVLRVVLRFDPQNLDLQLGLAGSLHHLGQEAESLEVYQSALDLAKALARDVRPMPAPPARVPTPPMWPSREQRVLDQIRKRFPVRQGTSDPLTKALGALAAFYHGQGKDDLAVPLWEKAIATTPDDAATAFGLARSYDAVGAWVSAIDYYKRAIELDQGNLEYRLRLGDRYYENDMTFQAINLWRDILAVRPTLVQARLKLAAAYTRLEQYPNAQREYERVLQLEPDNMTAKLRLLRLRGYPSGD